MIRSAMPAWTTLYALLFWPLLLGISAAAWRWGAAAERAVATVYVVAAVAEMALRSHHAFARFESGVAAVDLWLLAALLLIVVRHGRAWTYAAAVIQTLVAAGHLAKLVEPTISPMAYVIMTGGGGYPQLLLLLSGTVGTLLARRDRTTAAWKHARAARHRS